MYEISTIGLIILTAVMISASVQDVRTREVSDIHWLILGVAGIVMTVAGMHDNVSIERMMIAAGAALIVFDLLYDREWPIRLNAAFYGIMALLFIIPLITSADDTFVMNSMVVPACYLIFAAMFYTGAIKGGADVKCLISVAIMFPLYPEMFGYPLIAVPDSVLSTVISFPLAVLFHASIMSMSAIVFVIIRNIVRGDTESPNMLTGYKINAADAEKAHVWPMKNSSPDADGRTWVTPKIPFIVPITAAVLFVALIGNILFLL